jgi:two-component system NarL family sensor kinase
LEERLNMVERRAGIKAGVFCEKGTLEYIPAEWNEDLHWLIVEALNNSLKHAQAREVAITIKSAKKNLEVEVRDNGKGFDVRRIHAGGFGMRTMRERAKIMGGTLKVKSSSEGTSVYFKARIQKPLESRRP